VKECFFVADLHGSAHRYERLFDLIQRDRPAAVFFGGDLLPLRRSAPSSSGTPEMHSYTEESLAAQLNEARKTLSNAYPRMFLILGNDDARAYEGAFQEMAREGLIEYMHSRSVSFGDYQVYGYAYVPPTPFRLKDWERYDVSRYVDPGCVPLEEGLHSTPVDEHELKYRTIADDLKQLARDDDLEKALFLFHTPPYQTALDRAALDGMAVDHAPLDVHVGSIAVRRFIEERQPMLTLHGHVHESARLTGSWKDRIGRSFCFSASHDGPELALVRFEPGNLERATRELV
jgi:Icc-related predicted phosphoesterase